MHYKAGFKTNRSENLLDSLLWALMPLLPKLRHK